MYALRRVGVISFGKLFGLMGLFAGVGTDLSLWMSDRVSQAARDHIAWQNLGRWFDGSPGGFMLGLLVAYTIAGVVLGVLVALVINLILMFVGGLELELE